MTIERDRINHEQKCGRSISDLNGQPFIFIKMIGSLNMHYEDKVVLVLQSAIDKFIESDKRLTEEVRVALVTKLWFDHLKEVVSQAIQYSHYNRPSWLFNFGKFAPVYTHYDESLENALQSLDEVLLTELTNLPMTDLPFASPFVAISTMFLQSGIAMFLLGKRLARARKSEIQASKKFSEEFLSNKMKEYKASWSTFEKSAILWLETGLLTAVKASILEHYQVWIRAMLSHKSDVLEKEKTEIEKTVQTMKQEQSKITKELSTATRERHEAQTRLNALSHENQNLQTRLHESTQKAGIQNKLIDQMRRDLKNLNHKNSDLDQNLKSSRSLLETTVAEHTDRVMSLKTAMDELQGMLEASNTEKERLRASLQQALEVKARIEDSSGITECQKDELIPNLYDLEAEARSSHSILGRPLAQEFERAGQKDPDERVTELLQYCFDHFKRRWEQRILHAGKLIYKRDLAECEDIRRLLRSEISNSSKHARECRYDIFGSNEIPLLRNKRLSHNPRCEQLFGKSITNSAGPAEGKVNFCCCEFAHFCALMAINGFEILCLQVGNVSEDILRHFDIINEFQQNQVQQGSGVTYKMIWPAIKLPSSGEIVRGKAEKIIQSETMMDWEKLDTTTGKSISITK